MTDAVEIALIAAMPPTVVALGAVWLGFINRTKLVDVAHKVDGTQASIIAQIQALTATAAGLDGELKGRDHMREHMEARQDAKDEKEHPE